MSKNKNSRPSVLSRTNYAKFLFWLENKECPTPEFAENFITTLNCLYINRQGPIPVKRAELKKTPASGLSLKSLMETGDLPEKPKDVKPETQYYASSLDQMETEAKEQNVILPKIGDNTIPFVNEDGYAEAGYDSYELAKAIVWHYNTLNPNKRNGRPISMTFLQTVLYCAYGTVLAERHTRLTTEHPQMWEFGPMFPRVYSKMKKGIIADETAASNLNASDPALDEYIKRTICQLAGQRFKDITELHTSKSSPWGKCHKENGDKWSCQINDSDIEYWFSSYITKHSV